MPEASRLQQLTIRGRCFQNRSIIVVVGTLAMLVVLVNVRIYFVGYDTVIAEGNDRNVANLREEHSINNTTASPDQVMKSLSHLQHGIVNSSDINHVLITCSTKKAEDIQVSIQQFYSKDSKCFHSFKNDAIFFHVGKAGGGTVLNALEVTPTISHPGPAKDHVELLQKGPATTLIINVRDPVERFVSAFNWRLAILCHPNDDSRERGPVANYPHKYCKHKPVEEVMLREMYGSNPSLLAEALCEDSSEREQAIEHFAMIAHSRPIVKWLEFLVDKKFTDKISDGGINSFIALPVPLGKNEGGFERHIEQLSLHLLQARYGREVADAILQHAAARKKSQNATSQDNSYEHSSIKFFNLTKPHVLSQRGQCCLVRYLEDDYRLIQTMLGGKGVTSMEPLGDAHPAIQKACLWGDAKQRELCQDDLYSMLMKHAKYLDKSQSCSEVVGT